MIYRLYGYVGNSMRFFIVLAISWAMGNYRKNEREYFDNLRYDPKHTEGVYNSQGIQKLCHRRNVLDRVLWAFSTS